MKEIMNLLKDHIRTVIICLFIVLFVVIIIPVIFNMLFKVPAIFEIFAAEWSAGEFLSYYGTTLTCLSTLILSGLALWQNHVIKKANEAHTFLLERMEKEKVAPHIIIEKTVCLRASSSIALQICNVSDNLAQDIDISDITINQEKVDCPFMHIDYLAPHDKYKHTLTNLSFLAEARQIYFDLSYTDILSEKHIYHVIGSFDDRDTVYFSFKKIQ